MTLDNLVSIGRLQQIPPNPAYIAQSMTAARRTLVDASSAAISNETRFDAAYNSIMHVAIAALAAQGMRSSSNQPGHHQLAIQCLTWTLAISGETLITLDVLRKKRHLISYSGDLVNDALVRDCIDEATQLLALASLVIADSEAKP
ncbi:hypothetical protein KPL74_00175 [Bacillus sp. NP157]|nr:hypothetical protein KPL74_00175 [Bacillus sp. NP157]